MATRCRNENVAGEDNQPGDFLTTLSEIVELPSYLWASSGVAPAADELVRLRYISSDSGKPVKVHSVCLPFVYAKRPEGRTAVLDTRQHKIVRLDAQIGRDVWKRMRIKRKKKR